MKKRIVSFLMALVMAVSLLPVSAFAVGNEADGAPVDILVVQEKTAGTGGDGKMDAEAILATTPIGTCTVDLTGDGAETYPLRFKKVGADVLKLTVDDNTWSFYDTASGPELSYPNHAVATRNDDYFFKGCVKAYNDNKAGIETDTVLSNNADYLLMYAYNNNTDNFYVILLEWEKGAGLTDEQKKPLADLLATVVDDNTNYYQSNDRWNGKVASKTGFWTEFTAANGPRAKAQKVLETATTEEQIATATAALQAAIGNLIPTSQLNPTALYEAVTKASQRNEKLFTAASWKTFAAAYSEAQTWLDKLFDEDGIATEANLSTNQAEVDAAATTLTEAMGNLYSLSNVSYYQEKVDTVTKLLPDLIKVVETAKKNDYTAESWETFSEALTAAKKAKAPVMTETYADKATVEAYEQVFSNLYQQFYYTLTPAGEITVTLTYLDPEMARQGNGTGSRAGAAQQVKLSDDYSLYAAVNSLANKPDRFIIWPDAKIFINGVYVTEWYLKQETHDYRSHTVSKNLRLHPGDTVVVDLNLDPQSEFQPTIGGGSAQLWQYIDSIKTSQFVQSNGLEVKAGEPFTLTIQQAKAALGRSRAVEAGANMTLFISDMAETPSDNHPTAKQLTQNEKAIITDADGSASVTLYREGWYLIAAYDLREDEKGNIDNSSDGSCPSYEGKYYSANSGTAIWVHVNTPDDLSAVKNTLQSQLDKAYAAYAENYFRPAVWSELKSAYDTGTAAIKAAATSGDASDAQQTAIETIRRLQNNTTAENKQNLTTFRTELNKLSDDASLLSAGVKSTVDKLIACYEGMSDYQRRQLTGVEQTKYNSIKAFADTHKTFPEDKAFKLTVNVVGDTDEVTAALNDMTKYLREHPATQDRGSGGGYGTPIQTEPFCAFTATIPNRTEVTTAAATTNIRFVSGIDYAAYFQTRAANGTFTVDGAKWSISNKNLQFTTYGYGYTVNGGLTVTIGGEAYEIKSVTYQGIDPGSIKTGTMTAYDDTEYLGKDKYYINMRFEDAAQEFTMPYNDVTVTVTWGPVSENVAAARTAALSRLKTLYDSLGSKAQEAYNEGVKNINAASSAAAIDRLYQAAAVAMQEAAGNYGKVRVIVENTTFTEDMWPNGKKFWDGVAVDDEVALTADSTMMSCIVAALKENGYTQVGADSNYISSITVGDQSLGQFDGGQQSGWMGTLNDWFTNEGFAAFTVANGKLADGDVIRVMYTREGLGADLGGTWGNSDTTIKALEIQGGKLASAFTPGEAGNTYEYTLAIDGESADLRLTPTASNKNFLTKIFLNEKVTGNTEGFSFYKRTESIPVKAGDTIYVGCGARAWPTMNNQAGNTQESDGTWYVLRVVNANAGADYVTELISQLPEAAAVTYASYQKIAGAAAAARSALDALSKDEQAKVDASKLERLEDAIKGFRAIDDVRAQIDALPDADRLTTAEREAAKSAQKAYNALTAGQRDYLTGAQLEKITAIAAALTAMDAKHSSGSGSAYTGGHTFTTDLEPGSITGVFVDGKKLDSRYYTVSGSDVTLTADYLKTLRSGKHTVKIENATKVATGSFTLSGSGAVQSSRTGDPGVAIYFAMGAVSFLGSAAWLRKRKET